MISPHIHVPYDKISRYLDFIISKRLNLEIYFSANTLDALTSDETERLKGLLSHEPSLTIHAPFMDLSPGAVDSKVRESTMTRFHHILDVSEILKPKAVVFHSGFEKWKYALHIDLWLEKSLLTWRPLAERAAAAGTMIAIENIFEDNPENLKILMQEMGSSNFGICFDTGHFNLFNKVLLEDWLGALNPYIIELHIHDNDGSSDQHRAIGDGNFDFRRFFALLENRDCIYTIEAHNPENVLKSISALNNLLQEASDAVSHRKTP